MHNRLKALRKELNLTQSALGEKLGVGRTAISKLEGNENNLTEQMLKLICSEFNINEEWLRYGSGNMFVEPDTFSLDEYAKQRGCTKLEIELLKSLMSLSSETRHELISTFKETLHRSHDETTATIEVAVSHELSVEQELENYRMELEAVQKGTTSQALDTGKDKIS